MDVGDLIPGGRGCGGRGRGFRLKQPARGPAAGDILLPPLLVSFGDAFSDTPQSKAEGISDCLQNLRLTSQSISVRPNERFATTEAENVGAQGERCQCLTNFVNLRKTGDKSLYEYRLSFVPPLENTKLKRSMVKQFEAVVGPVSVFDGQTLYMPSKLPNEVTSVNSQHPNDNTTAVTVTIKFIKETTDQAELAQFYNTLFQRIMLNLGYLEIRRGFYKISEVRDIAREKLQIWPGVSLTVEVKDDGLMVMIDSPSRVLRMETIYDFYKQLKEKADNQKRFQEVFSAFAIGKIVLCQYSQQCYKIDDVVFDLNPTSSFNYKNGMITYYEYFKKQYNITINDITQPLLVSRIKPRKLCHPAISTEVVRVISLVPELCYLTGLTAEQRGSYKLVAEIGAITRLNPTLKASAMGELLKEITESPIAKQTLGNWDLELDTKVVEAEGRKISAPALSFYENSEAKPVAPNFLNEASRSCYHAVPVKNYVVLCANKDYEAARNFVTEYAEACSRLGIKLRTNGQIVKINHSGDTLNQFVKALQQSCTSSEVQFVVAILPTYRDDLYRAVKKICSAIHTIPSQCILSKTLRTRSIKKVVLNICLQINCKIGGSLWSLKMPFKKKVMIIGMDAAHDPTRKHPSVIALVATLNQTCTLHFSRCSFQPIHQEICTSLRVIFKDALNAYKKYNAGELPDNIIFYRDGGSAGTFEMLKKFEVDPCLEVLEEESAISNKVANFSYVCVAKRIPQRMLLMSEGKAIMNPQPGTVLDHTITEPYRYDFYIVSQQLHQGTVNPTHYTVLYETKKTKPDEMQKISYAMTFMYYNWAGTIKVPSVIQYSHKLGQLVSRIQTIPNRDMCHTLYFL